MKCKQFFKTTLVTGRILPYMFWNPQAAPLRNSRTRWLITVIKDDVIFVLTRIKSLSETLSSLQMNNAKGFCSAGHSFIYLGAGYTLERGSSVCSGRSATQRLLYTHCNGPWKLTPICAKAQECYCFNKWLPEHPNKSLALLWELLRPYIV